LLDLEGIKMAYDLENERVPSHMTIRPLTAGAISIVDSIPTEEVLRTLRAA
jgi:hypothetical protein